MTEATTTLTRAVTSPLYLHFDFTKFDAQFYEGEIEQMKSGKI